MIPITEPTRITAGDSLVWTKALADYSPADGWTLHYALFNAVAAYTIDTAADGTNHAVTVLAAVTAVWAEGRYDYSAYVTHADGRRQSLFDGQLIIQPDLAAGPRDGRTHARKMVDALEAALLGRATSGELDLIKAQFGDRAVERNTAELIVQRDKYMAEVRNEERLAGIAAGKRGPTSIKARFTR